MPATINKYLDPAGLDETVLNVRQIAEGLESEMQNLPYARPDGIYPDMTVGAVMGQPTEAEWIVRTSDANGTVSVDGVRGNVLAQGGELLPVSISGIVSYDGNGDEIDRIDWPALTLRAAGSIRDALTAGELVTRVGAVADASTLRVNGFNATSHYITLFLPTTGTNTTSITPNVTCSGFTATPTLGDKHCYITSGGALILLCNNAWSTQEEALAALAGVAICYELSTPTTQTISPALPMTYRVQQGGNQSAIITGSTATPVMVTSDPVNAGAEIARLWEAIQSLGYTRSAARPASLENIGSIDEVRKDAPAIDAKEDQE